MQENIPTIETILDELGFTTDAEHWISAESSERTGAIASLIKSPDVLGTYCFQTSPQDTAILPQRPAIYVAEAANEDSARLLHRRMWNAGNVPFLLVILPHQVRVYTGFNYQQSDTNAGLIKTSAKTLSDIRQTLSDFYKFEIDSGRVWHTQSHNLAIDKRVDYRLLAHLKALGTFLREEQKIDIHTAHALIGKFIYIRYLVDRRILLT